MYQKCAKAVLRKTSNIQIQENLFSDVHCDQFLWNAQIQSRDDLTSTFDEVPISQAFSCRIVLKVALFDSYVLAETN